LRQGVQENHSRSGKGVLRGLHYQSDAFAQAKLVRVVRGSVFDVAVGIRKDSSSYGKWAPVNLTAQNRKLLFMPKGFAHGFFTLSDSAEVQYAIDNFYSPEHEGGIIWNDPDLAIAWPIMNPILSEKDKE